MPIYRPPGWSDDHDDHEYREGANTEDEAFWTPPRAAAPAPFIPRIAFAGDGMLAYTLVVNVIFHCIASKIAPLIVVQNGTNETAEGMRLGFRNHLGPARIVGAMFDDTTDTEATTTFLRAVAVEHEARFPDAPVMLLIIPGHATAVNHTLAHFIVVCGRTIADALAFRRDADLIVVLEATPNTTEAPRGTPVFSIRDAPNAANDLFPLLRDAVFSGDDQ